MKIALSTASVSSAAAHGGAVVALRHASALARAGAQVVLMAPVVDESVSLAGVEIVEYGVTADARPGRFPAWRPNARAVSALESAFDRVRPDAVYDVHGPLWPLQVASRRGIRTVSMIGDYTWFCRRHVLVDANHRRCSGPDSVRKCFDCLNAGYGLPRRWIQASLRSDAIPAPAPLRLWSELEESREYAAAIRDLVDVFIVGDDHAEAFFASHGVATQRLVRLAQSLPDEALVSRRAAGGPMPVVDRPLRVAFVGRSDPEKGFHVLARAFEDCGDDPRLELWVVHREWATPEAVGRFFSDPPWFDAQLASGRIKLHRPGDSAGVHALMAEADVGVVPSLAFESPSLVLLEFVAQRTPIVRSESAGMDHVIRDGVNGRTFPYGDARELATILREVATKPLLLEQWRAALPAIASDRERTGRLLAIVESINPRSRTSPRETLHA